MALSRRAFGALGLGWAGSALLGRVAQAEAAAGSKLLSPAEQKDDIATFRRGFMDLDRAFTSSARAEAERRLSLLELSDRATTVAEFIVPLCQITALADNGHSICFYPRPPRLTLEFALVDGDFHVLAAPAGQADLLGARLLGIDGRSTIQVRSAVRTLFGGTAGRQDSRGADVLARPEFLHALGIAAAQDAATYRLGTLAGGIVERRLRPSARSPDWVVLPRPESAPWALREPSQVFRWRDAPEGDAVVVQLRGNADTPDRRIADFLNESEANRVHLGRANVVLDMRQNGGGDFLTTRDFMLAWPARLPVPGRFFVLSGPETFSAAIASIAYLKQAGGERVILVGEPPGDRMMFFAEGRVAPLPHSGAAVLPAGQRDDFATGCLGYDDCFAAIAQPGSPTGTPPDLAALIDARYGRRPLSVPSLDPDIPAPWTIADYAAGRDPGLQAVLARLQVDTKTPGPRLVRTGR